GRMWTPPPRATTGGQLRTRAAYVSRTRSAALDSRLEVSGVTLDADCAVSPPQARLATLFCIFPAPPLLGGSYLQRPYRCRTALLIDGHVHEVRGRNV